MASALILGCGYTGRRVAARLLARGMDVTATTRVSVAAAIESSPRRSTGYDMALYSIPPAIPADFTGALLSRAAPRRVVYLSSTAVYGAVREVDEHTPSSPADDRGQARLEAERAVAEGPWSWLILRPAGIYGPGRGVHESMRAGTYRGGAGDRWVSRIHVDDLAAICEEALLSDLTGAFPVADEEPCRAREIAAYCAALLGVAMPHGQGGRAVDRRVDGRAVCRALRVTLRYPSYRVGIPASLRE